ncbi:MAG: triose-phosphate isomerase [Methylotenera sp.]|nr:triose-phosphate isomerase [Methylotenera sp.]MDO9388707.1 triose-phosphate isomerase [Methylotenera sp.]MDP1596193.1 triose-phosphate isomerase [Methylotenera sp.]MDP1755408.1 triose-phosphate isomerase [Methylotenera sp.]MDP1959587.1 triose-phosphate isomerase [Methylotenera sp.]
MRRKLVVGNWKMHGDLTSNQSLLERIINGVRELNNADYVVCVPNPYLFQARELLNNTNIAWGGQNVDQHEEGAFTGAVAPHMLTDLGCTYVLLGHSERRSLFHETNLTASARFEAAIKAGLTPILCVGETLAEHNAGLTEVIVASQMDAVMATLDEQEFALARQLNMVFAYEPLWAVGTGKMASSEHVQTIHKFIRDRIAKRNAEAATKVRILYGGSLKAKNAKDLFAMPDVDGGLIGGASLIANEFVEICRAAN